MPKWEAADSGRGSGVEASSWFVKRSAIPDATASLEMPGSRLPTGCDRPARSSGTRQQADVPGCWVRNGDQTQSSRLREWSGTHARTVSAEAHPRRQLSVEMDEDHSSRRARRATASPGGSASRSARRRRHRPRYCLRRASDRCLAPGNQRPDRTHSGRALARSLPPQRRRHAGYALATGRAVGTGGCFARMR
jgi:hypothetical protein